MAFESRVVAADPSQYKTPLLAVLVPRGDLPGSLAALDKAVGGALARAYKSGDFTGKRDDMLLSYADGPFARLLLIGIGTSEESSAAAIRRGASTAAKKARALGAGTAALFVAPEALGKVSAKVGAQVAAEGVAQGAWHFTELKRPAEEPKAPLTQMDILAPKETATWEAGHKAGAAIGAGQTLTRGLQMLPSNQLTPTMLANAAQEIGKRHGIPVTVLDKAAIVKEKMGALLAVAQGSSEEPRFIVLTYVGAPGAPVVLVGKGVTFDTGGISIKPALNMEEMKYDMSGAAAVLGTFEMLGRLKPKVHVVGLVPTTENMPSGTAIKPGDVVTSQFGKTIEIINTDAEGRLILADALSYARRLNPSCVIDIATLTGAIVVALGHTATGLFGTDEALIAEIKAASERADERAWPLPLWDEYRELNKSDIADVKNSGGRPGGSISAGWFLREFVDGFPWAHLDIAGTAYTEREDASRVKGPTGTGVRLFSEFILARQG
jgi:leucyl aminopeptidase